jgi:hypothetical protein
MGGQYAVAQPRANRSRLRARGGFRAATGALARAWRRRKEIPGRVISGARDRGADPGRMRAPPTRAPAPDRGQGQQCVADPERETRHRRWRVILRTLASQLIKIGKRCLDDNFYLFSRAGATMRLFASRQKRC